MVDNFRDVKNVFYREVNEKNNNFHSVFGVIRNFIKKIFGIYPVKEKLNRKVYQIDTEDIDKLNF